MKILEDIIQTLERDVSIRHISRGPLWTAVVSRRCGLASALHEGSCETAKGKAMLPPEPYERMAAHELAALSLSDEIPEASLGMAAINSLINFDESECDDVNAADVIERAGRGGNVSIIGHFPFVDDLRPAVKNLWVIEKRPRPGDFGEDESARYLPASDVIAISSTTLINHTLESILEQCPAASMKILLGPTTPLSTVLFEYGIDIISGSLVTDTSLVLENVRRGVSFAEMKKSGGIRFASLVRDRQRYRQLMS